MPQDSTTPGLWPGMFFFERGWLSANNILLLGPDDAALVDTGYCSHAEQTVELVASTLDTQPLTHVLNTHLHSDHCGGNAALQARWPEVQTWIAPGQAAQVQDWDPVALSYTPTGQSCPRFRADGVLQPGSTVTLGGRPWQVHAAPGHDPHSIVLFEPERRLLISADALWEHGFGVVFPEIEGAQAFAEVAATLDVIERLAPRTVIPGHGPVFTDAPRALATARKRLEGFVRSPGKHALYAAKVLLKYKLLELQHTTVPALQQWADGTPYFGLLHQAHFADQPKAQWLHSLVADLERSGAAVRQGEALHNA